MEFKYEYYIGAAPEKVWAAFVSPEGTRATFFGCVIDSTFEEGSSFRYVGPGTDGDETVHIYGTILAYEENKIFSVLEHPGPSYRPNHAELESTITFTLEPVGETTKLVLTNNQFTENHPSLETVDSQWWMILSNLKTYIETGKGLAFGW
ncbi:SRPBCC family protein [Paenibacillus sp. LHD-38]|uniref:SRPBCC family protein n=1 Tax=Paenibacillus sp. LHD-38 TaxID=3072143 RepID=UPI00280D23EB|nr:SRPBCC family protein [Paenibacillus sp. LHD-38]MDQ8734969.1 SRPBCC family protein [Paenibacillus sp. LHD-38]